MHRTVQLGLAPDPRFQMAQRIGKMLFAYLIHRNLQSAVRIFPVAAIEQAACRRHPVRHIVIQRADIGTGQSVRHGIARLNAHPFQPVLLGDLLFRFGNRLAADHLFQRQLNHHYGVIIPKCERTHLARGKVLFF